MKPALGLFALLLLVVAVPGLADTPADFALRLRVLPAPEASVQRLELPAAVLASSLSPKLADLRLFDANGRLLPMELVEADGTAQQNALRPMPVLGTADALRTAGVSLRVGADGSVRVLSGQRDLDAAGSMLLAILLDTRQVSGTTTSLLLDAEVPASQPVTFTVEASNDLMAWRRLGQTVAFEPGASPATVQVPLRASEVRGEWLRVTWSATPRLLAPVTVRGATLTTRRPPADALVEASIAGTPSEGAWQFGLPIATPVRSMGLMTAQAEVIVPYRLLGRAAPEQAWMLLGTSVARPQGSGEVSRIALHRTDLKEFRVESEGTGVGFAAAPRLQLGLAPHTVAFAAAGPAPYTLAVGRARSSAAFLPPGALHADQGPTYASLDVPSDWRLSVASDDGRAALRRRMLLWVALAAGTATLGVVAWLLWRRSAEA
ncbi:DUF3999 family protein [Sabulicella glaciei]|uniref:DUF3999 domain-containing protein n=1 Tax=Sabulicella glaciei TaxID=2984948 RepID=A0ABT3NQ48_9PROT|nr:DUF3999 family protein [Roseococcus sp. MDT2-1-1]MCW8084289.1 DUF3999 domain-containing protein [Roseococcus sp. MDT2-1-1]